MSARLYFGCWNKSTLPLLRRSGRTGGLGWFVGAVIEPHVSEVLKAWYGLHCTKHPAVPVTTGEQTFIALEK